MDHDFELFGVINLPIGGVRSCKFGNRGRNDFFGGSAADKGVHYFISISSDVTGITSKDTLI